MIKILIFRCADRKTWDYFYYFPNRLTWHNSPGRPCNTKLSCLHLSSFLCLFYFTFRVHWITCNCSLKIKLMCNPNNYIAKSFDRSDRLVGRGFFGFSILCDRGSNFSPANFYIIRGKHLRRNFNHWYMKILLLRVQDLGKTFKYSLYVVSM